MRSTSKVISLLHRGRAKRVVFFSMVYVFHFVQMFCLSVNTITPELLQIPSQTFHCVIPWSKGQRS